MKRMTHKKKRRTDLAKQLRAAMVDSGLTRAELARQAKLGYASVHSFADGSRSLSLDNASALCKVLGLELRLIRRKG